MPETNTSEAVQEKELAEAIARYLCNRDGINPDYLIAREVQGEFTDAGWTWNGYMRTAGGVLHVVRQHHTQQSIEDD